MNPFHMGRRSFVARLPLAAAAAALPAVAIAAPAEEATAKAVRLCNELSLALNDVLFGGFRAVIEPAAHSSHPVSLQSLAEARKNAALLSFLQGNAYADLAEYHATRLGVALSHSRPGRWVMTDIPDISQGHDVLLFVQHDAGDPSFMMNFVEG